MQPADLETAALVIAIVGGAGILVALLRVGREGFEKSFHVTLTVFLAVVSFVAALLPRIAPLDQLPNAARYSFLISLLLSLLVAGVAVYLNLEARNYLRWRRAATAPSADELVSGGAARLQQANQELEEELEKQSRLVTRTIWITVLVIAVAVAVSFYAVSFYAAS